MTKAFDLNSTKRTRQGLGKRNDKSEQGLHRLFSHGHTGKDRVIRNPVE